MDLSQIAAPVLVAAGGVAACRLRKLSLAGSLTGIVFGLLLWYAAGWPALALLALFFVLGTAATGWKKEEKRRWGTTEDTRGRTAGQVVANAGAAALLALLGLAGVDGFDPLLLMAGCFSAATADTLSSELGTVYGKRFLDVLSFRKGRRGADGVVSLEGTGFGIAGSLTVALVYLALTGDRSAVLPIVLGGTAGNLADSLLGAALERRGLLSNNAVNFCNTLIGALAVYLLHGANG